MARFRTFLLVWLLFYENLPNRRVGLLYASDVAGLGKETGRANDESPAPFLYMGGILNETCYILYANGYAETAVQEARIMLSNRGVILTYLGLRAGWIRSATGGYVSVEVLLSQVMGEGERPLPNGLLLAGGAECGRYLLADPRIHELVQQMLAMSRPVGLLHPVYHLLFDLLDKRTSSFPLLSQESQTMTEFVHTFVQRFGEAGQVGGRQPSFTQRPSFSRH